MFRHNNNNPAIALLNQIVQNTEQSRALLLIGKSGWGKTAAALDIAEQILHTSPLTSSDFFYFRNDRFSLKASFFLKHMQNTPEAWTFLSLLQRRINASMLIEETLTMPTGVKLPSIKEQLNEAIMLHSFPIDEKFIQQLLQVAQVLDKKQGIPINVIREAITFHSIQSSGRVSILGQFDQADQTTQNAALKLIEEPHPNHWVILTAENEKNIIPTILSRTLTIELPKPTAKELGFLKNNNSSFNSSIQIMDEVVNQIQGLKSELINTFFKKCVPNIEHTMDLFIFIDKLNEQNHSTLFLDELIFILSDSIRLRNSRFRALPLVLKFPQYQEYSTMISYASTAELEELALSIEKSKGQLLRSVIKDSHILPALFLDIARCIRKVS